MDDATFEDAGEDFAVEVADLRRPGHPGRGVPLWRVRTLPREALTPRQRMWRLGSAAGGVLVVLLFILGTSPSLRAGAVAMFTGGYTTSGGDLAVQIGPYYSPVYMSFWPMAMFCCALLLGVEALALYYVSRGPRFPAWRRSLPLAPLAVALWSLWLAFRAWMLVWQFAQADGDTGPGLPMFQAMQSLPGQGLLTVGVTYLLVMAGFGALTLFHLQQRSAAAQNS